jgi:hypothetical protein
MTREQFIERWKRHVAGMALFGVVSELRDGPLTRAGKIMEIPAEVEKLLGQLYDSAQPQKAETNGKPTTPTTSRAATPQEGQANRPGSTGRQPP